MGMLTPRIWSQAGSWGIKSQWLTATVVLALSTVVLGIASIILRRPALHKHAPRLVKGWPIFGSIDFYRRRGKFLAQEQKKSGGKSFTFYYGKYQIVNLVGEAGRAFLYSARPFDLRAGFAHLLASNPVGQPDMDNPAESQINLIRKIIVRDRLIDSLPALLSDADESLRALHDGDDAVVAIFPHMHRLVYKFTHRTVGVHDVAESDHLLDSTLKHIERLEHCSPLQIMFSGVPLPGMFSKLWAGFSLHRVVVGVMNERRRTGRRETDVLQFLMDTSETDLSIVMCVITMLITGLLNTGAISPWLLCYLAENRVWYEKVQAEVDELIARHRRHADESVLDILQRVPYEDWDEQLPTINICLHETLRLNVAGPAFRKNLSDQDLPIPGTNQVVPAGAFAFYAMDDTHLDEAIYPDALRWDPGRHIHGEADDTDRPHEFLGWGAGLHRCLGIKFAKLEIFVATAVIFAHNEFTLVDKNGQPRKGRLPSPDRNDLFIKPPSGGVFFKCTPRSKTAKV